METNVVGLILSSGHEQVGRDKNKGIIGAQRNMFPTAAHTPKVKQGFIPCELFGGIV